MTTAAAQAFAFLVCALQANRCDGCSTDLPTAAGAFCDECAADLGMEVPDARA